MSEQVKAQSAEEIQGGFVDASLKRSSREVREQRGELIKEDLEEEYRRKIEDLEKQLRRNDRDQTGMFDFSPNNSMSMVMKDVDAKEIMDKDLEIEQENRNTLVKLNNAKKRYNFLFGKKYDVIEELI